MLTYEIQQVVKLWIAKLRRSLQQAFDRRLCCSGATPETDARQCAYALLLRLVSLKCMETRGLLFIDGEATEAITTRPEYRGLPRLLWQMRAAGRDYHADEPRLWRDGLTRAFRALAAEMGVAWTHGDEHALLWPDHPVLIETIRSINAAFPLDVYAAPDFLGWVYAFFHAEENRQLKARGAAPPRTPEELAALNRFYTPEWIVRFLVDNTLGRIWLQMHPDSGLRERLHYLVSDSGDGARLPLKPAREIRLLDPACGTMHFGVYACSLFDAMYQEELARAGTTGWPATPSVASPTEIPAAILAHNLHGIDIDPHALPVAALALQLTLKEQARARGIDPRTVPLVAANLCCGDALGAAHPVAPGSRPAMAPRRTLDSRTAPNGVVTWEGEAPAEPVSGIPYPCAIPDTGSAGASPSQNDPAVSAPGCTDAPPPGGSPAPLPPPARTAGDSRLDALLRQRYDVIVMNPPFGAAVPESRACLDATFRNWCGNLLCAFFARARHLCEPHGQIGMVFDFAVCLRAGYEAFRLGELLEEERLALLLHLGWDVLHANVEVGALVASASGGVPVPRFFDVTDTREKDAVFLQALRGRHPDRCHAPSSADLRAGPWSAFAYRLPRTVLASFGRSDGEASGRAPRHDRSVLSLEHLAYCPSGGMDAPSSRYYRRAWEVPGSWVTPDGRYAPFWNGAEEPAAYYVTSDQIVRWDGEGRIIENEPRAHMRLKSRYFQPCIVWGKRARTLRVASLDGHALSKEGQALFPHTPDDLWWLIAVLNSRLMRYVLTQYCGQHKYGSHVGRLPVIQPPRAVQAMLAAAAREIHDRKAAWDTGNEISPLFTKPWLLQQQERNWDPRGLSDLLDGCLEWEQHESQACRQLQEQIDAAVYALYALSAGDRQRIECASGEHETEEIWPQMSGKDAAQKRREHLCRLLSYLVQRVIEEDADGIVPLVPCGGKPSLLERVQGQLEALFGSERRHAMEIEIRHELGGHRTLGSWLARHYFRHHCALYKRRPIHWHIAGADGSFGALLHYHRLTHDTLTRLCDHYLGGASGFMVQTQRALERLQVGAGTGSRTRIARLQRDLADARALDERLRQIRKGEYPTRIPWRSDADQPEGWDPDIDHGVKVNLGPFEAAGVLAISRVG